MTDKGIATVIIKDEIQDMDPNRLRAVPLKAAEGDRSGQKYALVRGKKKVGELRRSPLNGVWTGYKWKSSKPLERAQSHKVLLRKMEKHV
jgi:hypothetical protein